MTLLFDATAHTYRVGGLVIPSVTARIQAAGLCGPAAAFYSAGSRERGSRVHLACLHDDEQQPVVIPAQEQGYLDSYRRWRDLLAPTWSLLEAPRYSERFHTAGTADRVGTIAGSPVVLDFKTGVPARWHGIQLAMYDLLYDDIPPRRRRRIVLFLQSNGRTAQSVEHHAPADYVFALNLMTGDTHGPNSADSSDVTRECDGGTQTQPGAGQSDH